MEIIWQLFLFRLAITNILVVFFAYLSLLLHEMKYALQLLQRISGYSGKKISTGIGMGSVKNCLQ